MRGVSLVLAVGLVAFGCKKKEESGGGAAGGAPPSTAEADALWAMAPEGASVGVVVSPRALTMIENAATDIRALFAQAPELAAVNAMLGNALTEAFGKPDVKLADVGLVPGKGLAFFVGETGGGIAVLPVVDRDKFVAATHGTKGTDADKVGKATCKTVNGSYICASNDDLFGKLGKIKLRPKLDAVGARGDIEVAGTIPIPGNPIALAAVLQLSRGTVVARASVGGVPKLYLAGPGSMQIKAPGDPATTAGFGVVPLQTVFASAPPVPLAGGVTLADFGRSLAGSSTLHIASGSPVLDIRVPLSDPKPASDLVAHCTDFPPLAAAGATVADGACHITVPALGYAMDMWVEGKELRIGKKGAADAGVAVPMGAVGEELAKTPAVFSVWGRGTLYGPAIAPMPQLPAMPPEVLMVIRGLGMLDEMGASVRVDGDAIKAVLVLRTAWANPDDVLAKIIAITPQMFLAGKAPDAAKAIADASPSSPFAADYKSGTGGMMAPMAAIGMLGAVAVPAFMDYMKHSKRSEAELQLNKLAKTAKIAYAESGAFPKGDALTPAEPCCQGPNARCPFADAAWREHPWSDLDFRIDEPTMFQYRYHSDGTRVDAEAIGDLDCDGTFVTYKLTLDAPNGNPTAHIEAPPPGSD